MTEPLIGCDPREVSPARAGAAFAEFAKQLCIDQGLDLTAAWSKAKKLKPELAARMCDRADAALPNAVQVNFGYPQAVAASPYVGTPAPSAPLAAKPFIAPAFQLPLGVSNDVFTAAWVANGQQSVRVDFKKVVAGVCAALMKSTGQPVAVVRRQMFDEYPNLCRFAGETQ